MVQGYCKMARGVVLQELRTAQNCIQANDLAKNSYTLSRTGADATVFGRVQQICIETWKYECGATDSEMETQVGISTKLCALSVRQDGFKGGAAASARAVCNADHFHGLYVHLKR
jgi:hypothetical protein